MKRQTLTYLLLILATILWGVWGYANKIAVTQAHPFSVQWMYSIPMILLVPLWFLLGRSQRPETNLNSSAFLWAAAAGIAATLAFLAMLFAMRSASATMAVALTAAYPVVSAVIAYFAGTEKINLGQIAAIGLIVIGTILFQASSDTTPH